MRKFRMSARKSGSRSRITSYNVCYTKLLRLPDMDVCELHIDRFQPFQANRAFRRDRSVEIVGEIYKVHFPNSYNFV